MTREKLIEKVAKSICTDWGYLWEGDNDDMQVIAENEEPYDERPSKRLFKLAAEGVINTIFDALKEPNEEMIDAYFKNSYAATTMAGTCAHDWQSMLAASPLAPEENK